MKVYSGDRKRHFVFSLRAFYVPLFWLFGFGFGIFLSHTHSTLFSSLMREALMCSLSIVGLCVTVLLPLIISAFAGRYDALLIICFLKALSLGFSGTIISLQFHEAAWLIIILFMFSNLISLILLCVVSMQYCNGCFQPFRYLSILCILICILLIGIDYHYIAPLLLSLF